MRVTTRLTTLVLFAAVLSTVFVAGPAGADTRFRLEEATISQVQQAFRDGRLSCRELVAAYLRRIQALRHPADGGRALDAIRAINPDALGRARALDRLSSADRRHRPLFCVPVLVKDNYDLRGMPTAAAPRALLRSYPGKDAFAGPYRHRPGGGPRRDGGGRSRDASTLVVDRRQADRRAPVARLRLDVR
jgi:hypothetical protein